MNTCPLTSTSDALVCSAAFVAMVLAVSAWRALFRILTFTILFCSSCLSISFADWAVKPSLPTWMVGFSSFNSCLTWRFIRVVILLNFLLLLLPPQRDAGLPAAAETRNHNVGLPFLSYANTAVLSIHEERVAVLAGSAPEVYGQAYFSCHGDFPRGDDVTARQSGTCSMDSFCLLEQNTNALLCYLLCG